MRLCTTEPAALHHPFEGFLLALALPCRVARAELARDVPERLRELAGDDPHLVRFALCDLRQTPQVLVGGQLRVGVAVVDPLEPGLDRLRLPLRLEDHRLTLSLGLEDRA